MDRLRISANRLLDGTGRAALEGGVAVLVEDGRIVAAGPDSTESAHLVARLTAELRRWLPEHVTAMDAGVAHTRTRSRLGGAPVVLTRRSSPPG